MSVEQIKFEAYETEYLAPAYAPSALHTRETTLDIPLEDRLEYGEPKEFVFSVPSVCVGLLLVSVENVVESIRNNTPRNCASFAFDAIGMGTNGAVPDNGWRAKVDFVPVAIDFLETPAVLRLGDQDLFEWSINNGHWIIQLDSVQDVNVLHVDGFMGPLLLSTMEDTRNLTASQPFKPVFK